MGKLITVGGRTLSQSELSHTGLSYTVTETDITAVKTKGNGQSVLVKQINLSCQCSGTYVPGASTFVGTGSALIMANTPRTRCENESILLDGDNVTITCSGTITDTSTSATSPGTATVKVTITDTNQTNIYANDS